MRSHISVKKSVAMPRGCGCWTGAAVIGTYMRLAAVGAAGWSDRPAAARDLRN